MDRSIFLMGFMGSGKSAIARELSDKYGLSKVDLDVFIEQEEGMTIAEIFSRFSENGFRDIESKQLGNVINKDFQIISLGGGTVLREENVKMIKDKGKLILLTASPETIYKRVKNDNSRPLLSGEKMNPEYIKELMGRREKIYHDTADIIIETDEKTPEEIGKEIAEKVGILL